MAKITGNYIQKIGGSVKNTNFRTNKRQGIILQKNKPIPKYTLTEKQKVVRENYKRLVEIWKKYIKNYKEPYKTIAEEENITTYNAFMKYYLKLMNYSDGVIYGLEEGEGEIIEDYTRNKINGNGYNLIVDYSKNGKRCYYFNGENGWIRADNIINKIAGRNYTIAIAFNGERYIQQEFLIGINETTGNNIILYGHQAGNNKFSIWYNGNFKITNIEAFNGEDKIIVISHNYEENKLKIWDEKGQEAEFKDFPTIPEEAFFSIGQEYDTGTEGVILSDFFKGKIYFTGIWTKAINEEEAKEIIKILGKLIGI